MKRMKRRVLDENVRIFQVNEHIIEVFSDEDAIRLGNQKTITINGKREPIWMFYGLSAGAHRING